MIGISVIKKVFIVLLALTVLFQIELIIALFNSRWDINTLLFFIPFLTLLSGCIALWMNHKIGIVLLTLYSTYAGTVLSSAGVIKTIVFIAAEDITNSNVTYMVFPTFEPAIQFLVGAIFLFISWILSRAKLLEDFGVNKNIVYRIVSLTTIVALQLTFR